tara:strand:+ start:4401 stop:4655 length:255 start_codon:yes stop_codon:yes gene_type:complete
MDKNFDFTTMELLLARIEKENNPELNAMVNQLITMSQKAGELGFTMKEIASLCTMGFIVSQEPELQSLVDFLLTRAQPNDDFLN